MLHRVMPSEVQVACRGGAGAASAAVPLSPVAATVETVSSVPSHHLRLFLCVVMRALLFVDPKRSGEDQRMAGGRRGKRRDTGGERSDFVSRPPGRSKAGEERCQIRRPGCDIRHAHISRLSGSGADVRVISGRAGHLGFGLSNWLGREPGMTAGPQSLVLPFRVEPVSGIEPLTCRLQDTGLLCRTP